MTRLLIPLLLACSSEPPICVVAEPRELRRGAPSCRYVAVLACDAETCAVTSRFRCEGRMRR